MDGWMDGLDSWMEWTELDGMGLIDYYCQFWLSNNLSVKLS